MGQTHKHAKQRQHRLLAPVLRVQVAHIARTRARAREVHRERGLGPARDSATERAECASQAVSSDAQRRRCACWGGYKKGVVRGERKGGEVRGEGIEHDRDVIENVGEQPVSLRFGVEGRAQIVTGDYGYENNVEIGCA